MEAQSDNIESVTISDILNLSTWNRQRTSEELQSFILRRESALSNDNELV